jgi:osmotically-inducible protein OsmY
MIQLTRESAAELSALERVHAVLEADTRLDATAQRLTLAFAEGILTIDGEVGDVASKRRTLADAASVPEVRGVVDRLRVAPGTRMQDGEIRDHVRDALLDDSEFDECRLLIDQDGIEGEPAHDPVAARGVVRVRVDGGVVRLDGEVPSWSHRRMAGVLAWMVAGTRDVENWLGVVPPEADNDGEMADALRLVLEREPLVDADQIHVWTEGGRVTLSGAVASDEQRRIAERDAWYVLGVDDVANEISVTK